MKIFLLERQTVVVNEWFFCCMCLQTEVASFAQLIFALNVVDEWHKRTFLFWPRVTKWGWPYGVTSASSLSSCRTPPPHGLAQHYIVTWWMEGSARPLRWWSVLVFCLCTQTMQNWTCKKACTFAGFWNFIRSVFWELRISWFSFSKEFRNWTSPSHKLFQRGKRLIETWHLKCFKEVFGDLAVKSKFYTSW